MKWPVVEPPIFPLDESVAWREFEGALENQLQTEAAKDKILPLFAFASEPPSTGRDEPEEKDLPKTLVLISLERLLDAHVARLILQSEPLLGVTVLATVSAPVKINPELPIADIFCQMTEERVGVFYQLKNGRNDMSVFFFRGRAALQFFDQKLRHLTRP